MSTKKSTTKVLDPKALVPVPRSKANFEPMPKPPTRRQQERLERSIVFESPLVMLRYNTRLKIWEAWQRGRVVDKAARLSTVRGRHPGALLIPSDVYVTGTILRAISRAGS